MEIIAWLILGLIAGAIASLLVPGRTPLGCLGVILVGLGGAVLGGFLFEALFDRQAAGLLGSLAIAVVGATLILLVLRSASKG